MKHYMPRIAKAMEEQGEPMTSGDKPVPSWVAEKLTEMIAGSTRCRHLKGKKAHKPEALLNMNLRHITCGPCGQNITMETLTAVQDDLCDLCGLEPDPHWYHSFMVPTGPKLMAIGHICECCFRQMRRHEESES